MVRSTPLEAARSHDLVLLVLTGYHYFAEVLFLSRQCHTRCYQRLCNRLDLPQQRPSEAVVSMDKPLESSVQRLGHRSRVSFLVIARMYTLSHTTLPLSDGDVSPGAWH